MAARVDAITFDFWDTLCVAPVGEDVFARRRDALARTFAAAGHELHDDRVADALRAVVTRFNERWADNEQFTHREGVPLLLAELEIDGDDAFVEVVTEAFLGLPEPFRPPLTEGVAQALDALRAGGVRIGIICDVGLAPSFVLRSHLEHHGILDRFDHWSFSDEVGVYKPDPAIFAHAHAGLGVGDPSRAAHIGDLRRTDVAGALGVGSLALRYTGVRDDPADNGPEADHDVAAHAELPALLGL